MNIKKHYDTGDEKFNNEENKETKNLFTSDTNDNLATNSNDNEISKHVSQRNNGEEIKENSRIEEIASAIRDSYQANAKELKGYDLEDFEKQVVFIYLEHKI